MNAKQKLKAKNLKRSLIFQTKILIVLILIIGVRGCNELKNVDGNSMSSTMVGSRHRKCRRSTEFELQRRSRRSIVHTEGGDRKREESW